MSAVAALSGLFLLGLAFYGQPALYIQQAREQWDALIDSPSAYHPDPDRYAAAVQASRQQQPVTRLDDERAADQTSASQPATQEPARVAPSASPAPPAAGQFATPQSALTQPAGVPSGVTQPAKSQPTALQLSTSRAEVAQRNVPQQERSQAATNQRERPAFRDAVPSAGPVPSAIAIPERHETTAADTVAAKPDSTKFVSPKPEPAKQKVASLKLVLAPPPVPQPSPPRQDTDDAQSVLARLRQFAPASAPPQQAASPPAVVEPKPRQGQSPSVSKLNAARAALASGRLEDARRLLQEAQLQLVFRPVNAAGEDSPSAGKGAADVAHALDALSANDVPLSRRYIDVAADDLSGSGTNSSIQDTQVRTTGYAPAYPPR
jgi:hypothetical protein